jgi:hypothetical protein
VGKFNTEDISVKFNILEEVRARVLSAVDI